MNIGIVVLLMIINILLAIWMYISCKEMNNKLARTLASFWVMTPTFMVIISFLMRGVK